MFPNFCGSMGFAGWLTMLLIWTGLVAVAVWGIARLFPDRPRRAEPPPPPPQAETPPSLIDSSRR